MSTCSFFLIRLDRLTNDWTEPTKGFQILATLEKGGLGSVFAIGVSRLVHLSGVVSIACCNW
jgi:hypothetical protein